MQRSSVCIAWPLGSCPFLPNLFWLLVSSTLHSWHMNNLLACNVALCVTGRVLESGYHDDFDDQHREIHPVRFQHRRRLQTGREADSDPKPLQDLKDPQPAGVLQLHQLLRLVPVRPHL